MNQKNRVDYFHRTWTFFTSVRLTVVLLLGIAVTSIIGTVIAQNQTPDYYIKVYGKFLSTLFYVLDIYDMYHSWWFQLLLAGLCINIIACSIHRLSSGWKIIFPKMLSLNPERIKSGAKPLELVINQPMKTAVAVSSRLVGRDYGYSQTVISDKTAVITAEKNRWTRIGVYVVHLSVILLILGALIGSIFGFEGYAVIPEGETVDRIQLKNENSFYRLPFGIRCDDFSVSFYPSGAPSEYKSSVTILEGGKPVFQKDIIVNDPLRYKGISFYQSGYDLMPDQTPAAASDLESRTLHLHITAPESGMSYTRDLKIGESTELPEGKGTFLLKGLKKGETFMGQDIGDALVGVITVPGKSPEEIKLPLRFPNFDKMRKGDFVFSIANADQLMDRSAPQRYYTGLQVTNDPGVWIVYAGFLFMIAGCFISFFMSHRQIVIEFQDKGKSTGILIYGTANKNKPGLKLKLKNLSGRIVKSSAESKETI